MWVVSHAIALCVFRRVSSFLLVYFRRVSLLLVFLLGFSCQQIQDELAVILVLSVCVVEFLGHVERMTGENKRGHNAASLVEFVSYSGVINDWCDRAQSALP